MGTISSSRLSAKPFRLQIDATLEDLKVAADSNSYPLRLGAPSEGWGSVFDDDGPLGLSPTIDFARGVAQILPPHDTLPRRLRVRHYWAAINPTARRQWGAEADWTRIYRLNAADFLVYEERPAAYTGLVTVREAIQTRDAFDGLRNLLQPIDAAFSLSTSNLSEALGEDFFLWLLHLLQGDGTVGTSGLTLTAVREISALNRTFQGSRFQDEVALDRPELASLVMQGKVGFGPAKVALDSLDPDAEFELELYPDGGFAPFRTSTYEQELPHDELGVRLFDDIWLKTLPALRAGYAADDVWLNTGRRDLRMAAERELRGALGI